MLFKTFEQTVESLDPHESVGMRLIGRVDPRTMTSKEFAEAPDRFYHGSQAQLEFDHFLNYRDPEVINRILSDGSMTLGMGLYTTPDRSEAENYSIVRGGEERRERPYIAVFVPYKARILDLRRKSDLSENGNVPKTLIREWTAYMRKVYQNEKARFHQKEKPTFGDKTQIEWFGEYIERLSLIERLDKTYDLRTILGTGDSEEAREDLPPMEWGAPPWVGDWMEFMLKKGIDGIVYHEGGEGEDGKGGLSVVFYNLSTIGTYASWHSQRGHGVI